MLLRHLRLILGGLLLGCLIATVVWLVRADEFAASSRFRPQGDEGDASRLAGLAAQFGIAVGGFGGKSESPDFYVELLHSEALLRQAVRTKYPMPSGAVTLIDVLDPGGDTEQERERAAIDELRDARVTATVGPKSGLVLLKVSMPNEKLAEAVNRRLLELVNQFNLETRQSQASAERQFVEKRFREAEKELTNAENAQRRFLESNRRDQSSPQLGFEEGQLRRRVDLNQQLYTTLAQAFEQARIDEVRNTPVITIVDPPEGSIRPAHPGLPVQLAIGGMAGFTVALVLALILEFLARQRAASPREYDELVTEARRNLRISRKAAGS